jgi:hypothetical protein
VSRNGGHGWAKVAAPPFGGYLADASMTADGTVFLSGVRMDVDVTSHQLYLTRTAGRTWTAVTVP